jgi:hypothetical protein
MENFHSDWVVALLVLGFAFVGIGVWINGQKLGLLVDARNKMSLSRLQLVLWSWLLISAFAAVAYARQTMNIDMPQEIWALMGISMGSAAGSVIVKGSKSKQQPSANANIAAGVTHVGLLVTHAAPADASLKDLFSGEEVADQKYVDIAKVQMFFFTLATVMGYALILWDAPLIVDKVNQHLQFPVLSTSLVTLLGISHAGYLTVKAAPKTPTA